jgi:deoxyribonuclease-4
MKYVGAHVSAAGGVFNSPLNAVSIGAKAFAFFTKNQRQWTAAPYDKETISSFKMNLQKSGILPKFVLPHDSYLINLGSPKKEAEKKSFTAFLDEIKRCELLGLDRLNFHPGSHLKEITEEKCMDKIAKNMNHALEKSNGVSLVIENTAGQGSNLGYQFEHLAYIIERIEDKSRVGICLDTCHTFTAGYDFRDEKSYHKTMSEFDRIVGFKYLMGMHLNDSKPDLGEKKDRHECIGKGKLGFEAFRLIMNDPRLNDIPLILETPDSDKWKEEIQLLYSLVK